MVPPDSARKARLVMLRWRPLLALLLVLLTGCMASTPQPVQEVAARLRIVSGHSSIKTVFLIVMENHNWSDIAGSPRAPYINDTLLHLGAHAQQYRNPPGNHPSLPNYLWLESGTNFGLADDRLPDIGQQSTHNHLVALLDTAKISWRAYEEGISGTGCPLDPRGLYAPRHNPFVYFRDVSTRPSYCQAHERPFSQLAGDLSRGSVARYNFITPNLCDDMHDSCSPVSDEVRQGDSWLARTIPRILRLRSYQQGGVIFITWDEGEGGDGPIGMIVLSPYARRGYSSSQHYTHSSTLRTLQEIFRVRPFLHDAANARDLRTMFTRFP